MAEIFKPSRNCWQRAKARRAAFVIDGDAYFRALYQAFHRARRSIFIVGWDLHSDLLLVRGADGRYEDRAEGLGVAIGGIAWNAKFADLDNDALPDLAPLLEKVHVKTLAGQIDGLDRVGQLVDVQHDHSLKLGYPIEVVVVGQDF